MSYTILLVDRDKASVERIRDSITQAGHEVIVAEDAAEAIEAFETRQPDLALIEAADSQMPAAELCQEIKRSSRGGDVPVVILAEVNADQDDLVQVLTRYGCDQLIEKSVDGEVMVKLLLELLPSPDGPVDAATDEPIATEQGVKARREPLDEPDEEPAESKVSAESEASEPEPADEIVEQNATESLENPDAPPVDPSAVRQAAEGGDFSFLAKDLNQDSNDADSFGIPEALERLSDIKSDEPEAIPQEADGGTDILDHLDSLFATGLPEREVEATPEVASEPASAAAPQSAPPAIHRSAESESSAIADVTATVKPAATPTESPATEIEPVPEPEPTGEPEKVPAAGNTPPGAFTPQKAAEAVGMVGNLAQRPPRAVRVPEPMPKPSGSTSWMRWGIPMAAGILILGAAFVGFQRNGEGPFTPPASGASSTVAAASTGAGQASGEDGTLTAGLSGGLPPIELAPADQPEPVVISLPSDGQETPTKPIASTPKPEPAPVKPVAAKPKPTPAPVKPVAAKPKPTPAPAKPVAAKPNPTPAPAKPVATKPKPTPAPAKPAVAKPEPQAPEVPATTVAAPESSVPTPTQPEPVVKVAVATPRPELVQPAPPEAAPAEPVFTPPEVVDRIDPVFTRKAIKQAAGKTIVLKLLIGENGRISRVVVDQGIPGSEAEAAAVSSVLRWRYTPATEDGKPVKAWTTARFELDR